MITTNLADGGWQILVHAEDPLGPWSDPVRRTGVRGIDPDLAWDDDGTLLVTYAGFGSGSSPRWCGRTAGRASVSGWWPDPTGVEFAAAVPVNGKALRPVTPVTDDRGACSVVRSSRRRTARTSG